MIKAGDIIHFKKERTATYCKVGGTYEYKFNLNDRYQIESLYNYCCCVKNLEDGTTHFITDMDEYLMSVEDWRDSKLNEVLSKD